MAVGRIGKARGVKGHAFVMPFTDDPEVRFAVGSVLATDPAGAGPLTIASRSDASGKLVLSFVGVDDREGIEALRGVMLVIERSARPELDDPDDFYTSDLIGLAARTTGERDLGPVVDVIDIAGTDYLVLTVDGVERLVPFVSAIVPEVDVCPRHDPDRSARRAVRAVSVLRLDVVTIFPDYLLPLRQALLGKAIDRGQVELAVHDLRQWTTDVHHAVDDAPYGGGPGMVMLPEPWGQAFDAIAPVEAARQPRLIIPTPAGRPLTQALAAELAIEPWLLFACGRYEGIDARVAEYAATRMRVDEISIGDYVLAGGEAAVLVIVEAVTRLIPGVLGNVQSAIDDSFADGPAGLLEAPAYTRPANWRGLDVPAVLLSGHHGEIAQWRSDQSQRRTAQTRPDLLD